METENFSEGKIQLEVGRVSRLRINRPEKRNAVSSAMWGGLASACGRIATSVDVRVLIIEGTGPHFCAGADISEFADAYASEESAQRYNDRYREVENAVRRLEIPVIANVRGACLGGGLGIALSADFRFVDPTVRIAITASRLGIAYSAEDSSRLIEKIGPVRAKDMLFSARTIDADEAHFWGLADRVVDADGLSDFVEDYACTLAEKSRNSLRAIKKIVNALSEPDMTRCEELRPAYSELFRGPDLAEGARAFIEKRDPVFS